MVKTVRTTLNSSGIEELKPSGQFEAVQRVWNYLELIETIWAVFKRIKYSIVLKRIKTASTVLIS